MTVVFAVALVALVLGWVATALFLPIAARPGWLDAPVSRSSHARPTPSSGGLALVLALVLLLMLLSYYEVLRFSVSEWSALGGVGVLSLLGAIDDRHSLPVLPRLITQLAVAAGLVAAYEGYAASVAVGLAVTFALAWLVNLYNFMDGIDGIAALQCTLTASGLALLGALSDASVSFQLLGAAVAGIYAGFLFFNWPPARLFMGDAGSLSAGLLLGWLGLWSIGEGWLEPASWLMLMSPFLLDTGLTLARRALGGQRLTEAHNTHLYQRLARHWGSHQRVDLALLGLHLLWLLPLALAVELMPVNPWLLLVAGLFPQLVLMAKWRSLQ